jgi:hypothetical protein
LVFLADFFVFEPRFKNLPFVDKNLADPVSLRRGRECCHLAAPAFAFQFLPETSILNGETVKIAQYKEKEEE